MLCLRKCTEISVYRVRKCGLKWIKRPKTIRVLETLPFRKRTKTSKNLINWCVKTVVKVSESLSDWQKYKKMFVRFCTNRSTRAASTKTVPKLFIENKYGCWGFKKNWSEIRVHQTKWSLVANRGTLAVPKLSTVEKKSTNQHSKLWRSFFSKFDVCLCLLGTRRSDRQSKL